MTSFLKIAVCVATLSVRLAKASVSRIVIERAQAVTITICTARPGIVIGKGGQDVDTLKEELKKITNKDVQINIFEVRRPDIDAAIVADNIASSARREDRLPSRSQGCHWRCYAWWGRRDQGTDLWS